MSFVRGDVAWTRTSHPTSSFLLRRGSSIRGLISVGPLINPVTVDLLNLFRVIKTITIEVMLIVTPLP